MGGQSNRSSPSKEKLEFVNTIGVTSVYKTPKGESHFFKMEVFGDT